MSHRPFVTHFLIELPASAAFLLRPSATLSVPQPAAHAVIRQYGLLLVVTNIITLLVARIAYTEGDDYLIGGLVKSVSGALALYHVGPFVRAAGKVRDLKRGGGGFTWAHVHMAVHAIAGVWLAVNCFVEL